ncbi:L-ascorbate metabolism protein UlaG, beta-lactamase superfamily [Roseateles sp. YR242]|uniref:MBL fold metallo-hydrolase n=1 Tax=Roseateles sp. YR242 TaxID=1855305 RepID=UPI0008C85EEE|nr:MBL fold metallo-hydrolase [Roseateles sp. YR242]SEK95141.1 L-ascorbate metabolism protein UlaG, beta-lactamase superfamily [Roseateles sp. YR242]
MTRSATRRALAALLCSLGVVAVTVSISVPRALGATSSSPSLGTSAAAVIETTAAPASLSEGASGSSAGAGVSNAVARAGAGAAGYRRDAEGNYQNAAPQPKQGFWKTVGLFWDVMFRKPAGTEPAAGQAIPVQALTRAQLMAAPDRTLYRLGHSTVLLKLRGRFWLTDPVFSERASPFSFAGPKRFHAPPIALDELPELEGVILSHDHYDHLDEATVKALAPKVRHFLTPLGVGKRLIDWGVPAGQVQQLDWWQSTTVAGVQFTATPAQHFSGRSLFDRNSTLWASWVIEDDDMRVFFSGDTGYFDGFKAIGERFGSFDLTLMETGAYDARWPYVHMQPEQTLQAHLDLRGRRMMPIHNGTFDLAMHRWQDPFERILALARLRDVELVTPIMGAPVDIEEPVPTQAWWQEAS